MGRDKYVCSVRLKVNSLTTSGVPDREYGRRAFRLDDREEYKILRPLWVNTLCERNCGGVLRYENPNAKVTTTYVRISWLK